MRLDKGPGRMLKLLAAAILAQRLFAGLSLVARFPLIFLSVLVADSLRFRAGGESPIYLEDVVTGILIYAGVGLFCWGLDHGLSLYTGRHAGPVIPALLFAVIDRAWPAGHFGSKRR